MPTPWDQKKKAEMARMLAEAEAEAISSDARDEDFTMGGDEGGWEAFKAGFGKEATYGFGDEAAAALSGVETTDEERIAANEEMDAVINKNAINAALGFVGGVVPSIAGLAYGTLTKAAAKAAALAATKAAGPAAGLAASKLAAKEVIKKITPLKAIGINAAEGAVSGVGEGEGVGGRALGGVTGATIGALVGGGTQAAGKVAQTVYDNSSAGKIAKFISDTSPEEAAAIERAALDAILKKEAGVKSFKLNEKPPDAPETLIDEETGKPYTRDYLERKRITKETERKSPALRRVIREKDVENDDMEMARKRQEQLKFPFPEDPEAIDIGQPEMNIERKIKKNADIGPDEPDVNVPFVDDSMDLTRRKQTADQIDDRIAEIESDNEKPTGSSTYERLQYANRQRELARLKKDQAKRPGTNLRLDFSDVDVDEDGNFIGGNASGLLMPKASRRPTADELPTDEEITSANEAAAITLAMKKKNIPLNEARLEIPGREMPTEPSTPDAGMKMSDVPGGGGKPPAPVVMTVQNAPDDIKPGKEALVTQARETLQKRKAENKAKDITVKDGIVVDQDGKPLMVYKGSKGGDVQSQGPWRNYIYTTDNPYVAATFANQGFFTKLNVQEMRTPFIYDANGATFDSIPVQTKSGVQYVDADFIVRQAAKSGYDGVIIKNLVAIRGKKDPFSQGFTKPEDVLNSFIVGFKPEQITNSNTKPLNEVLTSYSDAKDLIDNIGKPEERAARFAEAIARSEARAATRTVDLPPSVILSDIQGTAALASETSPAEKAMVRRAEKEYEKQFSSETAAEAAKKEGSKSFWANRPDPELNLGVDEVDEIMMNPAHPLLREPIQAAASADKGYQLALREWKPNKRTPRRNAEQIILMNSGLAPLPRSKLAERTIDQYDADGKLIPEDELLELLMEDAPTELWNPVNERGAAGNLENPNLTWKRNDSFGSGASGRVYPVIDRNGNRKVAKISIGQFNSDIATHKYEKEAARVIQNVRANATPNEKSLYLKHFPDFQQILDRPDSSTGYIFVMDELRPMNDIEKAELFDGRKILKELLEKKGYKNVDEYMNATGQDFRLPSSHNIAIMPKTPHAVPGYRRVLTATDYDNMTPRVRSFYKALEFMSGKHGIGWGDMHPGNVMINPKTGDYVASDIGSYNQRNNPDYYYRFPDTQIQAESRGTDARVGDAKALAADIAENEIIARARAADKDIKALSPAEMARRFTKRRGN